MKAMVPAVLGLLERGMIPDAVIRYGMRQLLKGKIAEERSLGLEKSQARILALIEQMRQAPIAVNTAEANQQHYEVPTEFFKYCLGIHLKYSSCYYQTGHETLSEAEEIMLSMTCARAEISDGMSILEFGCGWGSLSLFMAQKYPKSRITSVSNSRTQKEYIDGQARERGLTNLTIITADMNAFETNERYDRIVSVEMFEHMRNWSALLAKAASFLKDQGKLFIHIFTHREYAYFYDHTDPSDFIGKYFFTGGIMPSDHLMLYFQDHIRLEEHWRVCGTHYGRTAEHWLANMDQHREPILEIFKKTYGHEYLKWWHYWRLFYMACAELWNYNNGEEWLVSHYRFIKR